jgi:hypothetical protein
LILSGGGIQQSGLGTDPGPGLEANVSFRLSRQFRASSGEKIEAYGKSLEDNDAVEAKERTDAGGDDGGRDGADLRTKEQRR